MNLSKHTKLSNALNYAAGTASRNGAILDMADWDGVLMIVKMATIAPAAVGDIHAEQDTAAAGGTMADLADTGQAVLTANSNQIFVIDLYRPRERYVRLVVTKDAANSQAESAVYLQYRGRKLPVSNMGADSYELHVSPAEGTK